MEYLRSIMESDFMPHGHCFRWTSDLLWLHVGGDSVMALAYYLIPIALAYYMIKSRFLPYPFLFILVGAFILACGTTHVLAIVTLWHPFYRLEGLAKVGTALASIGTALMLLPVIPRALNLRSPKELERLNRQLEQKNRELESSRESFRNIVERNQEGILVLSRENEIVFANQAALSYLEGRFDSLSGAHFGNAIVGEKPFEIEIEGADRAKKTTEIWVSESQWEGLPARLVNLRDVTFRKQTEEALKDSREQFQQAQKMEAIGRLAGGIAHDFNNLLTAINGFCSLALAKLPETSPIRDELVEVTKAGDRAAQLTRQLLAFSRKQVLAPRNVDLNKVVSDIGNMIRRIIGEDVRLSTQMESNLPDIRIDPGQLEQIILNLAVNARDAMPMGGELLLETRKVTLGSSLIGTAENIRPGDYCLLAITDKGVGMTEEVKARLFEPFFTTKSPGKGTGLGLSTVYGIVKQSEGHIIVYSELGKGTSFKLYFPLARDGSTDPDAKCEPADETRPGTETILLVEDETPVRRLVLEVLQSAGYTVLAADDGESALESARAFDSSIHLLLTDVIMRKVGGSVVARKLVEMRPETRVLFMSGFNDDAIVHHGVLNASLSFIQKPFSPSQLLTRIRKVLDTPQPPPFGKA